MNAIWGFLTGLLGIVIPGFGTDPGTAFSGYIEAEYVYAAPASPGRIESFSVAEGQLVEEGEVLFALDHAQQDALLAGAEARVAAADATAKNLATGGRAAEVDVIRASLNRAKTDLALAQTTLERSEKLSELGLTPKAKLDQDRATWASAEAQVEQLSAQLQVAELPARNEQQLAAEANLLAARADVAKASSDLAERTVLAPSDGIVDRLFFSRGEMASVGQPVVALLPAGALKVKFYVDEPVRASFALGDQVGIGCDACAPDITAHISRFAADPQFTPPVIYSRDERARLVYLVEAIIDAPKGLHPGQPVSVEPMK
ncbi:HlyD family efflux transporter periplasmic adaptor subunit [Devosia rhodophyticola]|uniref:HlyD family efflux transporter periplasmic adaptor subunit n=1 Tax=Devosia rhodophyticola TaxID=3026423 RepID=A0ABY7YT89_9HYPH|nr:HlyD family efflux transporter periplasmic adaptor subunit [Devosia rhodophyticola]WDR04553.1 HlyD family efflux transporter periplasmic adaptor subunit [Devosia rhodophyticola]